MNLESTNGPVKRPGGDLIRSEKYKTQELNLVQIIKESGLELSEINPLIYDMFTDKNFVSSIPEEIKNNSHQLAMWLRNSNEFNKIRHSDEILGEGINIPETKHADGRIRREESARELVIEEIRKLDIDPNNVLYFRRTQPSETISNPEHYWTSDYWETFSGLNNEISGAHRDSSVILCSSLEDISSDSRLIPDINDDNGLPIRRENQSPYDQKRALFIIKP
jgi:hypothetical protein